jgi:hypothetical protein
LRYLAASKRPAAPHMIMGHAGAVAAVQLKKAQILGLRLEVLCSRGRRSTFAADPTDKEEACVAALLLSLSVRASRGLHALADSAILYDTAHRAEKNTRTLL